MLIVNDVLSPVMAKELTDNFVTAKYEQHAQVADNFYPDGEDYRCRFKRSKELEESKVFHSAGQVLVQVLDKINIHGSACEFYAYKMMDGDYFREHDDAANGIGIVLYLTPKWRWDWGGILMISEGETYIPVVPKYNRLVVVPKGRPHFVTQVMEHARNPRYAVVGFVKP